MLGRLAQELRRLLEHVLARVLDLAALALVACLRGLLLARSAFLGGLLLDDLDVLLDDLDVLDVLLDDRQVRLR